MHTQLHSSVSVEQVVERIMTSRQITRADQYSLLAMRELNTREQMLLNWVFDRLRMGLLKVVD